MEQQPVRFGLSVATLGDFGDPRFVMRLAQKAEAAGWEALFVWDHLAYAWGVPAGDPWVILSAVATSTRRLLIGTAVTPLPRRRLQVLPGPCGVGVQHSPVGGLVAEPISVRAVKKSGMLSTNT